MSYKQQAKLIAEMVKSVDELVSNKTLTPNENGNTKYSFLTINNTDTSDEHRLLSARIQYLDSLIQEHLISDKGQLTRVCDELEQYEVNIAVLERDIFGPLVCGLIYTKGNWCRVFY